MSFTKSKIAWIGLVLLVALIAGGIHIAGEWADAEESHESVLMLDTAARDEGEEPLEGAALLAADGTVRESSVAAAEPPEVTRPGSIWHGQVLDAQGRAVAGASLFALPHGARGASMEDLQDKRFGHTRTDGTGRFRIAIGEMDRPRLIAWSDDLRSTSVSLQDRDPTQAISLTMGATRWLRVLTQLPQDAPLMDLSYRLETLEEKYEYTDDPTRQGLTMFLDEPGVHRDDSELTIRLNTAAAIRVQLDPPTGFAAMPRSVVVQVGDQPPTIRILPSAEVRYQLIDAATRSLIGTGPRTYLRVWDAATDEYVASRSSNTPAFEVDSGLSPGRYRYELKIEGYETLAGEFQVRVGGEVLTGPLALVPRPATEPVGRMLLRIERGPAASEELRAMAVTGGRAEARGRLTAFVRMHGSAGALWFPTESQVLEDGRFLVRPSKRPTLEARFEPGLYDLYVACRDTGLAGRLTGVRVFDDRDSEVGIRIEPGTFFRLADVLGADTPLTSLDIRAAGLRQLPALQFSSGGFTVFVSAANLRELLRVPRRNRLLGPFPAGTIEVHAVGEGGTLVSARVSGANVIEGK